MTESVSTGNESPVMSADSRTDPVESFVSVVTDALAECGADDETLSAVESHGSAMVEHVDGLRDETEQLREELSDVQERMGRQFAEVRSRVTGVEEKAVESQDGEIEPAGGGSSPSESEGVTGQSGEDGHTDSPQSPRTALGDCVTVPQPIQEAELSVNVRRATAVASGAIDYCRSVPAGYAITSSELRTVLTALKESDGRTYTETVGRVIDYLDELGGDCVEVTETMGGQRTVVFDDAFVKRTVAWRQSECNGVVTGREASGAT